MTDAEAVLWVHATVATAATAILLSWRDLRSSQPIGRALLGLLLLGSTLAVLLSFLPLLPAAVPDSRPWREAIVGRPIANVAIFYLLYIPIVLLVPLLERKAVERGSDRQMLREVAVGYVIWALPTIYTLYYGYVANQADSS